MTNADAPTPWELQRNYNALREDMRHGFQGINQRLDKVPTAETMTAWLAGVDRRQSDTESDVADLQAELKAERLARLSEQSSNRRMVIGAVLAGVISIAVALVGSLIGGGPS